MKIGQAIIVECYIQKTLLTAPGKKIFLCEKASDKRIEFVNADEEFNSTLANIFMEAKICLAGRPTIYERFGTDILVVRGTFAGRQKTFSVLSLMSPVAFGSVI